MALVGGAVLLPAGRAGAALAGLALTALGMAALGVTPGPVPATALGRAAVAAGLPPEHLAIDAALVLVGVILALGAAVRSLRRGLRGPWAGCAILALAGGALLWSLRDLLLTAGPGRVVAATLALGLGAAGAPLAGRLLHLGAALRWLDSRVLARSRAEGGWPAPRSGDGPALAVAGVGALALVVGRHVALAFGGAVAVAAGAQWYLGRRPSAPPPLLPLAVFVLLAPAYWLLATVAGPVGLGIGTLGDVPLSPAAEVLLALPLAAVVWGFAGLWPLHGFAPGPLLFPAGVLLWLRVAAPAVPDGLRYWEPLVGAAAVAGIWHAAATRRLPGAVSGLALLALAAAGPEAAPAVWGLALSGAGLAVLGSARPDGGDRAPLQGRGSDPGDRESSAADRLEEPRAADRFGGPRAADGPREPRPAGRLRAALRRLGLGLALWSAAPALEAALHAEVGYGVLAALGLAAALWAGAPSGGGAERAERAAADARASRPR